MPPSRVGEGTGGRREVVWPLLICAMVVDWWDGADSHRCCGLVMGFDGVVDVRNEALAVDEEGPWCVVIWALGKVGPLAKF